MRGDMLRGGAAIAAMVSGHVLALGPYPVGDGLWNGGYRAPRPPLIDLPCPARRTMPGPCPRS